MKREYLKELNEEQKAYVQSNNNVLVSASAGTGKTSTMVVKLLDLIVDKKIAVNELLVVTFTNAAAWEMKQRLLLSLNKYLIQCDNSEKEYIQEQIELLPNCDIGTIHGICRKWIVKYFNNLSIDPNFSLLDDVESRYYFNVAMKSVLNKFAVDNDEEYYELFLSFNKTRDDSVLKEIINKIYNFIISKIDIEGWVKYLKSNCYCSNAKENICCNYIKNHIINKLASFEDEFMELKRIADAFNYVKYSAFLGNKIAFINELKLSSDFEDLCKRFNAFVFSIKPSVPKSEKDNVDLVEFDDKVTTLKETFNKHRNELKKYLLDIENGDSVLEEMDYVRKNISLLFDICLRVKDEYSTIKKRKNLLDFNDIEHCAFKLISDPEILCQLKSKYKFIFIDEYQDVNELQEFILCSLENNNNLNMIGDVKQSIYAFRRSTPKIFIEKYNRFLNNNGGSLSYFNRNYRSDNNILQFVNLIFNELITKETIGIDYKKDSQLVSGFESNDDKSVKINIINSKIEETPDDEKQKADKQELDIEQCELIAKHISDLIGKSYSIGSKTGFYGYKDIAILIRNKGDFLNQLIKTLKLYNIPVSASYKTQIFKEVEILYLLSVLKIIDNPLDDVAIVTVMKGKLGGFNENELMKIAINDGEFFYNKMMNYINNEALQSKIKSFLSMVEDLRFYFQTHDLLSTINKVIYENNLLMYYKSLPNGFQRELNILEFVKLCSSNAYSNSIYDFLNYVESIKNNAYEIKYNAGNNCVQVMTMHGSKGLGYPAVIVANFGSEFRINHNVHECVLNDDFGLGIQYRNQEKRMQRKSIVQNACLLKNKISEINEEIRILYVALTRAKNNLFIVGAYDFDKLNKKKFSSVYDCSSYMEMFLFANSGVNFNYFKNKKERFVLNEGMSGCSHVEILSCGKISQEQGDKNEIRLFELKNEDVLKNIECFKVNKDFVIDSGVVKKNTVSSLLMENNNYTLELDDFNLLSLFDEKEYENSSTELGTLYHNIMEKLTYSEGLDQVINKVNEILTKVKVSDEIKDKIDFNKIYKAMISVKNLIGSPESKIKKEQQFVMKVAHKDLIMGSEVKDKVIVQGVVDLIIVNPDKTGYIIDFKSNKSVNAEYYANHYKTQLYLYKLAISRLYNNVDFKTLIYSFEAGRMFEI